MEVIRTIAAMQARTRELRAAGQRVGLVPTMGYLHEAHLSLVRLAREHAGIVVASIYVNPTQFGEHEDFSTYPRDFDRDCALCEKESVAIVFAPEDGSMYAPDHSVYVDETSATGRYEGAFRPGHFRGVATVVAKLFNAVLPDLAVFGEKDAQQLFVIRKMAADLNFPVEIVAGPTVREADGLAMSSRNVYLDAQQRASATCLSRSLEQAAGAFRAGTTDPVQLKQLVTKTVAEAPGAELDYIEVVDDRTFAPAETAAPGCRLVLAVRYGTTRLLDNLLLV